MATNKELLEQQIERVGSRRKAKGVEMPRQVGVEYLSELRRIIRAIRKDINEQIMPALKQMESQYRVADSADSAVAVAVQDSWVDTIAALLDMISRKWTGVEFQALADRLAQRFVMSASDINAKKMREDLSLFGVDIFTDDVDLVNYLQLSARDNSRLIKSISSQYLTQVESIVIENVRAGNRPSVIQRELVKQFGVTDRRAKFIARDQTAKVNGDLTERRQRAAGFEYFQWMTMKDSRVRDRHASIANRVTAYGKGIYRWDNLPLSDKGEPIKPGLDYGCRCFPRPVSQREVDENKKAGRVNPAVKR